MSFTSSSYVTVIYQVNPKDVSQSDTSNSGYTVRTYNTTTGEVVPSIGGTPTNNPGLVSFSVSLSDYGSYIIDVIRNNKIITSVSITRIDSTSVLNC